MPGGLVGGDISELILKPPVQETLDSFNGISDWGLAEEWGSPPSPPPAAPAPNVDIFGDLE